MACNKKMTDRQRKAMFARMSAERGGSRSKVTYTKGAVMTQSRDPRVKQVTKTKVCSEGKHSFSMDDRKKGLLDTGTRTCSDCGLKTGNKSWDYVNLKKRRGIYHFTEVHTGKEYIVLANSATHAVDLMNKKAGHAVDFEFKGFKKAKKDSDGDGVPDNKDCAPFDPKKQGVLHDWQIKRLKAQEEKLERVREKEQKKLEDLKDTLKERQNIASKKASIKQTQLRQKQAVIDEINREKKKINDMERANRQAKEQLDKLTVTGKTKTALKKAGVTTFKKSREALQASNAFLHKKSTQKTLKKIRKAMFG